QYLQKALAIFTSLADQRGMSATYNNLGVLYTDLSEFNISLNYLDSALMLFRKIKDSEGEGSVLNYIGINYQEQGNYQKAIDYCLQGFELRKKIKDHPGVVFSLINVGNMYFEVGQPQTALNFYNQSVTYAQEHNMDPFDYSLNQIGKTYLKLKQYAKAETYLIRKRNLQGMPVGDPIAIGDLYSATGKFDSAITQFKINLAGNNYSAKALSLAGLSKVFLKEGKYELAGNYAQQAYLIADSAGNKLILADVAGVLAAFYKTNGDYNKALQFFELAHSVTDSISGENYQRKLAFTESKSEIENEQARVKLLLRDKELQEQKLKEGRYLTNFILILLGIFAMAIFLSIFIIRNINSKRKKIQSQKDVIELQSVKVEKAYEELKSTQAQLIQSEKMASLGELTAGIAHEIQNPLNFVNNFSEVNKELLEELKTELETGNQQQAIDIANDIKENEEKINHHGKRAGAIVKNMLQHSRSSTSQREPTDINKLADEYLRMSYHGMRAKDKSFNAIIPIATGTNFDDSIGKINIIPQDIGRVLLNLYNNAFYAVHQKQKEVVEQGLPTFERLATLYDPAVWVSTKKDGDKVLISVKDNGNGIPKKIVNKIFQPFFTTKPTGQGTGLGLSLSYDIVKAHGGEIKVESNEEEGTEFIVQLPFSGK
ncbi:MAG: tetratricopeptide repeat-containing sensor histidine kinase, partial [Bacteroidota bacterium]|nr:tetratricopeptide repeat-containing sensor histidine kinase [Bacteroidota bacterium]